MHQNHDFQSQEDDEFQKRFPPPRHEIDHASRGFQYQECQPEVPDDAKRAAAAAPVDFELRLNFRFEDFQVFVDTPGGHAAKLAIDQREVGKYRQAQRQQHGAERVYQEKEVHVSLSLRRNRASTRSISPRSVSWS